ncbi:Acyl-coenzyme A:6-aminopenicillanic acid acyl-transferase [Brevibacterium linens]|uniref:Acyl-coenzyme A:6-aminopenicillanic acid acyl-transferase n=2 Tax=Brevibacterium linens TaxID=1703 RepID=A0A2H1KM03_BRELN|nr:Acyl-coenzyme A:6-aminopenicillanic acid acyl-transferase [Brevibacterium linens]
MGMPERSSLIAWRSTPDGRRLFDALAEATAKTHEVEMRELESLARGADLDFEDLLLANLRGDIGTGDGTGCSDLAWCGEQAIIAHDEDAAPALEKHMMFLTLVLDGDVPVTSLWYPGFVPANAFSVNGHGVGWGINHIQVVDPPVAAGRHFVARGAQQATTAEQVETYLRAHATAGGFAYTIGDSEGNVIVTEAAAGQVESRRPNQHAPFAWHTNHLRFLPSSIDGSSDSVGTAPTRQLGGYEESRARGAVLAHTNIPNQDPEVDWFVSALTAQPLPNGVHRTAADNDPLMTLCSVVLDLNRAELTARGSAGRQEIIRLADLHSPKQ